LNDLAFSPDGRYLATLGYQDDHVFIWSIPDGRPVMDWGPQEVDRGGSLLWTEKGLHVASNGGLSLWEPLTASLIHRFTNDAMQGLACSPDGRLLAATSYVRGTVRVWDTATHQSITELFAEIDGRRRIFPAQGDFLLSVSFSRCGRWLAAGGYCHGSAGYAAGLVHFWDIAMRRHLVRFFTQGGPVGKQAFTPTGRLLTADWFGAVALWDVPEGRLARDWTHAPTGNIYRSLAANASGQIALQRADGVYLWRSDPGRERMLCPAQGFSSLAYSDDGRFVACGKASGRVNLYDAATGADVSPADRHITHVDRVEFSADGTLCLAYMGYPGAADQTNEIVLRDIRTGVRLNVTPPRDWRPWALSPAGPRVAGRLNESRLAVWDWVSGDVIVHPDLDPQVVAWHPDGRTLVAVSTSGEVTTWQPSTGRGRRQPVSSSGRIVALAVAAEGRAAALSDKGELSAWQLDREDPPRRLAVPAASPRREFLWAEWPLALAPDGLSAAVARGDGIVHAGSLSGDELRAVYNHPPGDEEAEDGNTVVLRYTLAGQLLIAGTRTALRDHHWWYTHVVTDGLSGEVVWRSQPQLLWATALALSPDGRSLLTGHEDGTLLVWPLCPGAAPPS
jgi:WD40 repeat protein